MRDGYQDRVTKTALLLAIGNLAATPIYFIFGRTAGFLTTCATNFFSLKYFHEAGTGIHGRPLWNVRDRGMTFFTNDNLAKLENSIKNVATGGEVVFDNLTHDLGLTRR